MLAEFTQLIEDAIQEETQPLSDEQDIVYILLFFYQCSNAF